MDLAIHVWQALIIAIWMGLVLSRFSISTLQLRFTTLMTALVVGLTMGDVTTALITGVVIQLALFNVGGAGGSASAEPAFATAITVPIVLLGGLDPFQSVVLALPLGVLGSYLYRTRFTFNTKYMKEADEVADSTDSSALTRAIIWKPLLTSMALYVAVMFILVYFGAPLMSGLTEQFVQGRIGHILSVIGRGLAAVGLAAGMVAMGKAKHLPFFFLAFVLGIFFPGTNLLIFAILAAAIAIIYVMARDPEAFQDEE